jgi:hypothetical protein
MSAVTRTVTALSLEGIYQEERQKAAQKETLDVVALNALKRFKVEVDKNVSKVADSTLRDWNGQLSSFLERCTRSRWEVLNDENVRALQTNLAQRIKNLSPNSQTQVPKSALSSRAQVITTQPRQFAITLKPKPSFWSFFSSDENLQSLRTFKASIGKYAQELTEKFQDYCENYHQVKKFVLSKWFSIKDMGDWEENLNEIKECAKTAYEEIGKTTSNEIYRTNYAKDYSFSQELAALKKLIEEIEIFQTIIGDEKIKIEANESEKREKLLEQLENGPKGKTTFCSIVSSIVLSPFYLASYLWSCCSSRPKAKKLVSRSNILQYGFVAPLPNLGVTCYLNACLKLLLRDGQYWELMQRKLVQRRGENDASFRNRQILQRDLIALVENYANEKTIKTHIISIANNPLLCGKNLPIEPNDSHGFQMGDLNPVMDKILEILDVDKDPTICLDMYNSKEEISASTVKARSVVREGTSNNISLNSLGAGVQERLNSYLTEETVRDVKEYWKTPSGRKVPYKRRSFFSFGNDTPPKMITFHIVPRDADPTRRIQSLRRIDEIIQIPICDKNGNRIRTLRAELVGVGCNAVNAHWYSLVKVPNGTWVEHSDTQMYLGDPSAQENLTNANVLQYRIIS